MTTDTRLFIPRNLPKTNLEQHWHTMSKRKSWGKCGHFACSWMGGIGDIGHHCMTDHNGIKRIQDGEKSVCVDLDLQVEYNYPERFGSETIKHEGRFYFLSWAILTEDDDDIRVWLTSFDRSDERFVMRLKDGDTVYSMGSKMKCSTEASSCTSVVNMVVPRWGESRKRQLEVEFLGEN
jgi:hypothetical protein